MPKIWPILSQGFTNVFTRLGIQAVPRGQQWFLSDTLIPVSLVDSDIVLQSVTTPANELIASVGELAAPLANVDLANTGPLAAGNYHFRIFCGCTDNVNDNKFDIVHRNAADTLNLVDIKTYHALGAPSVNFWTEFTRAIAFNEFVRVRTNGAGGAGSTYIANIFFNLV